LRLKEVSRYVVLILCLVALIFSAAYALEEVSVGAVAEYNSQHAAVELAGMGEHGAIASGDISGSDFSSTVND
jgi:hypothetical protein